MDIQFKGKTVLVTGATSGIGKAVATGFAGSGATVVLTGRNRDELSNHSSWLLSKKFNCHHIAGDLTDETFRRKLISTVIEKYGRLDILVNAAGIIGTGSIESTTLESYDRMMDVNLRSLFHLTQLALPHLIEVGGNIVNVSSVTGTRAFPGILAYCISKAGVDQLTKAAALELAVKGVRVNAVNPGVVETNLHRNSGYSEETYQKFLEHSKTTHPIGRVGQPEEVADLILFLASEKAGWITGSIVNIDGGRHQTCAR